MQIENNCADVDVTKPTITGIQDGRILKLTMHDNESGIYGYCVTKGDECEYIKSEDYAEYTLSEMGTYQVYAKDKRGNISNSIEFIIGDVFEPTVPNIGSIGNVSGSNPTGTIQMVASGSTDDTSDVVYKYLVTNDNVKPDKNDERFSEELTFTRSCGTTYYAWAIAEDAEGNRSDVASLGSTSDGANQYSGWTGCNKTCGGGTQTRTNTCALVTTELSQSCNTQSCAITLTTEVDVENTQTGPSQWYLWVKLNNVPSAYQGNIKLKLPNGTQLTGNYQQGNLFFNEYSSSMIDTSKCTIISTNPSGQWNLATYNNHSIVAGG